ncbi:hypothetical protein [Pedosphaera parvula]|uniref:Uncharacterized protein n=1 Tax=Pedosphaera parvula (strain Ellin514) TaxID=320771 RepID=B9XF00_PEDPL|nr:hypothetical protein [Pedosphaera parvula]EEF61498.1 hypothetical protein Cflav_PD4176 [Pedosphaera parvula Ellin514]
MEFLKKHYEKLLLGLVLLGLTIAAALLPFIISGKRKDLDSVRDALINPKVKELPALDLSAEEAALQQAQTPVQLILSGKHNLFNPVLWQKTPDNRLVKIQTGNEVAGAAEVMEIRPLYLTLSFDSVSGKGYLFGVENQAGATTAKQQKHQTLSSKETPKNDYFTLREAKGPAESPTAFILELNDTGESVNIAPGKPYKRVEGYEADLKYGPENNQMKRKRVGAIVTFAGGQYNIVAISQSNVVLSAKSNDKKTTLNFNAVKEPR